MPWITGHAPTSDELSACIQCGLCLPVCPTYRLTGDETASPRGRLTAMSAVAAGIAEVDDTFADMMGFCLQCRACEPACPSLVPFGRAMEGARAEIAAQLPSRTRALRSKALGSTGLGSRTAVRSASIVAALGQAVRAPQWVPGRLPKSLAGLRPVPFRRSSTIGGEWPAFGEEVGTAALLAGCVMDDWFGPVHEAAIAVLRRAGYRVVVPEQQTCCGALAAHDGAIEEAATMAARNAEAFAGCDLVVTDSAGCGAHLKEYRHFVPEGTGLPEVRDVTEVVAAAIADGRLPALAPTGRRVAVQDPCHLRHAQRIVEEPRALIRAAGHEVVEIDPAGMCCGAAGVYSLRYPETSAELGKRKADQVRDAGVDMVASANPGCEMQLRTSLRAGYTIRHPVEIYAEALSKPNTAHRLGPGDHRT